MSYSYSSVHNDNDEWYTPKEIVNYFGKFDYDPATTPEKAKQFGIENYDTKETNGLTSDWTKYKQIWINPPFTLKQDFVLKMVNTYKKAKNDIYILLPIDALSCHWFWKSLGNIKIRLYLFDGRITFENATNKKTYRSPFGCVIVKPSEHNELVKLDLATIMNKQEQISLFDLENI